MSPHGTDGWDLFSRFFRYDTYVILRILDFFWTNSVVRFSCYLDLRPSPPPSEVDSDPEFSDEDVERLGIDDRVSLC